MGTLLVASKAGWLPLHHSTCGGATQLIKHNFPVCIPPVQPFGCYKVLLSTKCFVRTCQSSFQRPARISLASVSNLK